MLNVIISPQRSVFVGGRLIQDNLIVAQEAFHFLKNKALKSNQSFSLKLDMNKAYDRVDWNFLREILVSFELNPTWVSRVMSLVTIVKYCYQVNGSRSRIICPGRGMRQGDPFSSYLLILVFDVFSRLVYREKVNGNILGLSLAPGAPTLTHLFFADDAIVFGKASTTEIYQIVESREKINLQKLGLIVVRQFPSITRFTFPHSSNSSVGFPW